MKARDLLKEACAAQLRGDMRQAAEAYAAAVEAARSESDRATTSEALRRLAVVHHLRSEPDAARDYAQQSLAEAREQPIPSLVAEALNVLAGFVSEAGVIDEARRLYLEAIRMVHGNPGLEARIEQNLGILANIQGDNPCAVHHYTRALAGYHQAADERGCAMVYHNLGMLKADQGLWEDAREHFASSLRLAQRLGDRHLEGLCLLNQAEVFIALEQHDEARTGLEAALDIFDQFDSPGDKADAYRLLGVMCRETGRLVTAESWLRSAVETATRAGASLGEAEACLELARLYRQVGRRPEALRLVERSGRIFARLGARTDLEAARRLEGELAA